MRDLKWSRRPQQHLSTLAQRVSSPQLQLPWRQDWGCPGNSQFLWQGLQQLRAEWELWVFGHFVIIRLPLKELAKFAKLAWLCKNPSIFPKIKNNLQHIFAAPHFLFRLTTNHNHFRKSQQQSSTRAYRWRCKALQTLHFHPSPNFFYEWTTSWFAFWPKRSGPQQKREENS